MTIYFRSLVGELPGFGMFGLLLMRYRTFQAWVLKLRSEEYHRGYKTGHVDGVIAGHSKEWHDGYNEGARIQNGVDLLNRTLHYDGKVTTVMGLADTLRVQNQVIVLKDQQIEVLNNRIQSLQNIIRMLDSDDDSGDSE